MLKERIEILRSANVINDDVAEKVNKVIDHMENFQFDQSKMEMFTTHLAMATQRIVKNEEVEQLDDEIWKQIVLDGDFEQAKNLMETMEKEISFTYPESEKKFLIMHLCNLLKKGNEDA